MAGQVGDLNRAFAAAEELATEFAVNSAKLKLPAIEKATANLHPATRENWSSLSYQPLPMRSPATISSRRPESPKPPKPPRKIQESEPVHQGTITGRRSRTAQIALRESPRLHTLWKRNPTMPRRTFSSASICALSKAIGTKDCRCLLKAAM